MISNVFFFPYLFLIILLICLFPILTIKRVPFFVLPQNFFTILLSIFFGVFIRTIFTERGPTFAKTCDGFILITCVTMHFVMYNNLLTLNHLRL